MADPYKVKHEKQGIGADSKVAMTIETLVNESIIVSPLFNVKKICDILYLKRSI